ncbi:extracellular solute-binding protein [Pseudonocardia yunnanensis]|uniref:Extracellular solute-binding protein n=1 Tax=Pseudonocardia yunnanensis TaxID=58107 RepID=A0ABW4FAG0_9PSEU
MPIHNGVDRRSFLRAGLTGAAMLGAAGLLSACGGGGSAPGGASQGRAVTPTYVPYANKPPADLPGNDFGLADTYLKYPSNPMKLTEGVPGDGSDVSAMVLTYDPIVPGVENNRYWQEVNQRLGVNLKMQQVPAGDYGSKLPTVLAGNDIPDFVQFQTYPPSFPDLLKAKFQDLAPFLAGDKVKDYPFLANIPGYFWDTSVMYNGGIYGIPIPAYKMVNYLFTRDDIIEGKGLSATFGTFDEFLDLVKAVNDPRNSQWALTHVVEPTAKAPAGTFAYVLQCMGVGNVWSENNGTFTSYHADERTKEAISVCAGLVKDGYVHPEAFSGATVDFVTNMAIGRAVMGIPGGLTSLPRFFNLSISDKMRIGGAKPVPYAADTDARAWQRTPAFSITAIKQSEPERIKTLLEIANYLATPFGSEEYRFINFGSEGTHWNSDGAGGDPVITPLGKAEFTGFGLPYIACPPRVLYTPGIADSVRKQYEIEKSMMETSVANASLGLYSETEGRKWATLERAIGDAQAEIMKGNQPLSTWDDAVRTWKAQGGDRIAQEYQEVFAASR